MDCPTGPNTYGNPRSGGLKYMLAFCFGMGRRDAFYILSLTFALHHGQITRNGVVVSLIKCSIDFKVVLVLDAVTGKWPYICRYRISPALALIEIYPFLSGKTWFFPSVDSRLSVGRGYPVATLL